MRATVERVSSHAGELFAEVSHRPDGKQTSPLRFAVPLTQEVPVGTQLDIVVTVADVPKEEKDLLEKGAEVSIPTVGQHQVVETSPIAREDTAPSGQSQVSDVDMDRKNQAIADESDEDASKPKSGKLPEGFPGRSALEAEDQATFAKVRKLIKDGTLREVPGIGPTTADKIEAEFTEQPTASQAPQRNANTE